MARQQKEYIVAPGKETLAALVEEVCSELGLMTRERMPDTYELSRRAELSDSYLHNVLADEKRSLGYDGIYKLAVASGRPPEIWAATVGKKLPGADKRTQPVLPGDLSDLAEVWPHLSGHERRLVTATARQFAGRRRANTPLNPDTRPRSLPAPEYTGIPLDREREEEP